MDFAPAAPGTNEAELAYTRSTSVGPDEARPGLLRARTLPPAEQQRQESFDVRTCRIGDLAAEGAPRQVLV
jgi:hypothetical protein